MRLKYRPQITTDGLAAYAAAIGFSFGAQVDWAILQKDYSSDPSGERRYSPAICTGVDIEVKCGNPDPTKMARATSSGRTSQCGWVCVARRATDQRLGKEDREPRRRRGAPLHALQLARPHSTLANPYPRTPAMAAGVADHISTLREIAALLD
jgi:hypothetical protein